MDNYESAAQYYHFDDWGAGEPDAHLGDRHLYIRRYWNAIVLEGLHAGKILPGPGASVNAAPNADRENVFAID